MCTGAAGGSSGGGGNGSTPQRRDMMGGLAGTGAYLAPIPAHQTATKPRGYSGNDFSSKYEAGKPLPAGDKNSASYWMNLTSTDGGKTLHNDRATTLALEHGYKNAAYQIDHKNERQKAGIKDLDPAGFNTNFYKGNSFEGTKGHPAERKSYSIPSDKQTINALPKLIMNTNLMRAMFGGKPAKGTKTKDTTVSTKKRTNKQSVTTKGSLLTSNNKYSGGTSFGRKNKLGA